MKDLIKALQILLKYGNPKFPFACEHETLYIVGIDANNITEEDKIELRSLGFIINNSEIYSYKYGSA